MFIKFLKQHYRKFREIRDKCHSFLKSHFPNLGPTATVWHGGKENKIAQIHCIVKRLTWLTTLPTSAIFRRIEAIVATSYFGHFSLSERISTTLLYIHPCRTVCEHYSARIKYWLRFWFIVIAVGLKEEVNAERARGEAWHEGADWKRGKGGIQCEFGDGNYSGDAFSIADRCICRKHFQCVFVRRLQPSLRYCVFFYWTRERHSTFLFLNCTAREFTRKSSRDKKVNSCSTRFFAGTTRMNFSY